MNVNTPTCLLLMLACAMSTTANAIEVSLSCPRSIGVAHPFEVYAKFKNKDCTDVATIDRLMVGLAGNKNGGLNLQGPFNINVSPTLVIPPATCDRGWLITPGEISQNVRIVSKTPSTLAGKIALAYVEVLQSEGRGEGGDACLVEVTR